MAEQKNSTKYHIPQDAKQILEASSNSCLFQTYKEGNFKRCLWKLTLNGQMIILYLICIVQSELEITFTFAFLPHMELQVV